MERKYYQKPDIKKVQLKIERLLNGTGSYSGGSGQSRELRSVWKDGEE